MGNNLGTYDRNEVSIKGIPCLRIFFFFVCAEAFTGMVHKEEMNGAIQGILVTRSAPLVSHLLFVDDALIFCKATQEVILCLRGILLSFEKASRLKINLQKLVMVFSTDVAESLWLELASILGVAVASKHDKCLGLPMVVGRSKELFEGIKDRIWMKLHNWSTKKLSQAGRAVLLKSVLKLSLFSL
ncbi:UNVERIFIED_CONTAM: hypothetical protein Sradi_3828400 [Sesamum radiatum]|uniref:Reverse transcriptase domain-containing protein n=1 Tax=Sesamum radiatum TaxID=300843 RepID=A0AAW2Q0X3_SESRA